jgi:hypothetical protein
VIFAQFSATKLAFFSKTNAMVNFSSKFSFVSSQKRQFFGENILKIITSVPACGAFSFNCRLAETRL